MSFESIGSVFWDPRPQAVARRLVKQHGTEIYLQVAVDVLRNRLKYVISWFEVSLIVPTYEDPRCFTI